LVEQPRFPGCLILDMIEESAYGHKILALHARSPRYEQIHGLEDVPPHVLTEVQHFFEIYKELEGKTAKMKGWQNVAEARAAIQTRRDRYLDAVGDAESAWGSTSRNAAFATLAPDGLAGATCVTRMPVKPSRGIVY